MLLFNQLGRGCRRDHVYGVRGQFIAYASHKEYGLNTSRAINCAEDAINLVPTTYPQYFINNHHRVLIGDCLPRGRDESVPTETFL